MNNIVLNPVQVPVIQDGKKYVFEVEFKVAPEKYMKEPNELELAERILTDYQETLSNSKIKTGSISSFYHDEIQYTVTCISMGKASKEDMKVLAEAGALHETETHKKSKKPNLTLQETIDKL